MSIFNTYEYSSLKNYIETFKNLYKNDKHLDSHFWFACHAAFFPAFTKDILFKIWTNFREENCNPRDSMQEPILKDEYTFRRNLNFPISCPADLVSSSIIRQLSFDSYEINFQLKFFLQECLATGYGQDHVRKLAKFIKAYLEVHPEKFTSNVLYKSFEFTANNILDRDAAIRDIIESYNKSIEEEAEKDFTSLEAKLDNLESFTNLLSKDQGDKDNSKVALNLIKGLVDIQLNNRKQGIDKLKSIKPFLENNLSLNDSFGLKTLIGNDIIAELGLSEMVQKNSAKTPLQKAYELIQKEKENQTGTLDLSGLGLTEVPEGIFELKELKELNLSRNAIVSNFEKLLIREDESHLSSLEILKSKTRLRNIEMINLIDNPIVDVAEIALVIAMCKNTTYSVLKSQSKLRLLDEKAILFLGEFRGLSQLVFNKFDEGKVDDLIKLIKHLPLEESIDSIQELIMRSPFTIIDLKSLIGLCFDYYKQLSNIQLEKLYSQLIDLKNDIPELTETYHRYRSIVVASTQAEPIFENDIFLGRIEKIRPGLNATFVDLGERNDAFLHFTDLSANIKSIKEFTRQVVNNVYTDELLDDFILSGDNDEGKVDQIFGKQDLILVKVTKLPIAKKGPRLSCEISIAGKYLVLTPFNNDVFVSKKIENPEERKRLKTLIEGIKPKNFGIIIRTVSNGEHVQVLHEELKILINHWSSIVKQLRGDSTPRKLYREDVQVVQKDNGNWSLNQRRIIDLLYKIESTENNINKILIAAGIDSRYQSKRIPTKKDVRDAVEKAVVTQERFDVLVNNIMQYFPAEKKLALEVLDYKINIFKNSESSELDLSHLPLTVFNWLRLDPKKLNRLIIKNCGLTNFPKDLYKLTNLKHLDVSDNAISAIGSRIISVESLEVLIANNCKLTSIPKLPSKTQRISFENNLLIYIPSHIKDTIELIYSFQGNPLLEWPKEFESDQKMLNYRKWVKDQFQSTNKTRVFLIITNKENLDPTITSEANYISSLFSDHLLGVECIHIRSATLQDISNAFISYRGKVIGFHLACPYGKVIDDRDGNEVIINPELLFSIIGNSSYTFAVFNCLNGSEFAEYFQTAIPICFGIDGSITGTEAELMANLFYDSLILEKSTIALSYVNGIRNFNDTRHSSSSEIVVWRRYYSNKDFFLDIAKELSRLENLVTQKGSSFLNVILIPLNGIIGGIRNDHLEYYKFQVNLIHLYYFEHKGDIDELRDSISSLIEELKELKKTDFVNCLGPEWKISIPYDNFKSEFINQLLPHLVSNNLEACKKLINAYSNVNDPGSNELSLIFDREILEMDDVFDFLQIEFKLHLLKRQRELIKTWEAIVDSYKMGSIIMGTIVSKTAGGLIVDVNGLETFLPGTQIDVRKVLDYESYIGKTMEFKVILINEEIKNATVSHRACIQSWDDLIKVSQFKIALYALKVKTNKTNLEIIEYAILVAIHSNFSDFEKILGEYNWVFTELDTLEILSFAFATDKQIEKARVTLKDYIGLRLSGTNAINLLFEMNFRRGRMQAIINDQDLYNKISFSGEIERTCYKANKALRLSGNVCSVFFNDMYQSSGLVLRGGYVVLSHDEFELGSALSTDLTIKIKINNEDVELFQLEKPLFESDFKSFSISICKIIDINNYLKDSGVDLIEQNIKEFNKEYSLIYLDKNDRVRCLSATVNKFDNFYKAKFNTICTHLEGGGLFSLNGELVAWHDETILDVGNSLLPEGYYKASKVVPINDIIKNLKQEGLYNKIKGSNAYALPEKWILIVGTSNEEEFRNSKEMQSACKLVAEKLYENNIGLLTFGWTGVDREIQDQYSKLLINGGKTIKSFIKLMIGANDEIPDDKSIEIIKASTSDFNEKTFEMLSLSSGVIVIGGDVLVKRTIDMSVQMNVPVFSIPQTGGQALYYFERENKSIDELFENGANLKLGPLDLTIDSVFQRIKSVEIVTKVIREPSKWILVLGWYNDGIFKFNSKRKAREAIKVVARKLFELNYGLVTSGYPSVDRDISDELMKLLKAENKDPKEYIKIRSNDLIYQDYKNLSNITFEKIDNSKGVDFDDQILKNIGGVVVISGGEASEEIAINADSLNIPVLPIPNTGGSADKLNKLLGAKIPIEVLNQDVEGIVNYMFDNYLLNKDDGSHFNYSS